MTVLGLVIARGGSKRIPRKNLRPLGGVPLFCWSIACARHADSIDYLVVSSEDKEIIDLTRSWGAEPLWRPQELATDDASPYDVMKHALDNCIRPVTHICLLHPTSPFRIPPDIDACVNMSVERDWPVVSCEWGRSVPNGAVYCAPVSWIREGGNFDSVVPLKTWMPTERSIDLDTEADWTRAEKMLEGMAA